MYAMYSRPLWAQYVQKGNIGKNFPSFRLQYIYAHQRELLVQKAACWYTLSAKIGERLSIKSILRNRKVHVRIGSEDFYQRITAFN